MYKARLAWPYGIELGTQGLRSLLEIYQIMQSSPPHELTSLNHYLQRPLSSTWWLKAM